MSVDIENVTKFRNETMSYLTRIGPLASLKRIKRKAAREQNENEFSGMFEVERVLICGKFQMLILFNCSHIYILSYVIEITYCSTYSVLWYSVTEAVIKLEPSKFNCLRRRTVIMLGCNAEFPVSIPMSLCVCGNRDTSCP